MNKVVNESKSKIFGETTFQTLWNIIAFINLFLKLISQW